MFINGTLNNQKYMQLNDEQINKFIAGEQFMFQQDNAVHTAKCVKDYLKHNCRGHDSKENRKRNITRGTKQEGRKNSEGDKRFYKGKFKSERRNKTAWKIGNKREEEIVVAKLKN